MKIKIVGIIILFNVVVLSLFAQALMPQGSGSASDPYQIASFENLLWVSENTDSWTSNFIQTADIDASQSQDINNGQGWSPLGYWHSEVDFERFTGSYNGNNHVISGIYINRPNTENVGFFGELNSASVSDLGLINLDITAQGYAGSLAGYSTGCSITNCFAIGSINAEYWVGGLIGGNVGNSHVESCFTNVDVNASGEYGSYVRAGGFVGVNRDSAIINCYSLGDVTSEIDGLVGGFIGYNAKIVAEMNDAIIQNCYSIGKVLVENNYLVGGFAGENHVNAQIINSYWDIDASEYATSDGGQGRSSDEMTFPYSDNTYVGWDFQTDWFEDSQMLNEGYPYLQSTSPVANESNEVINLSLKLENYPNPFNPQTRISFTLMEDENVSLDIYNLKGQKVRTLHQGKLPLGQHSFSWNGKDDNNKKVVSGIYFTKIITDSKRESHKMILMK